MSVFAPSVINLWKTMESYGVDPEPLFREQGIEIRLPVDPCLRLPYEKVDRIRAMAVETSGDEAFGLRAATVYLPSQLGALGYAWQASLTLRKACLRLERFVRIVNDKARVRVEDRDSCMVVMFKLDLESANAWVRDVGGLALVTRMCRMVYGEGFRLQAVDFEHAEPADLQPYFEFFGCRLRFNQAQNRLWIPAGQADETLSGANPELALLNDEVVTRRLARIDKGDIVARLRAVLLDQLPSGEISDDTVAAELHMSVRTLHRKLATLNTSFKVELAEMRRNLAQQYILDNSLTLTEISMLLGFSESSSFSRAFKNWTGSTPTEARRARQ
jgi:AraC-like DNA-binding protein